MQQAVLERLNLDQAAEQFIAGLARHRERLESLGRRDDAADLRAAAESIRVKLGRISDLLRQAGEIQGKGSAGRLAGLVGRLRDETSKTLRLLTDDTVRSTRIVEEPLGETSRDPVAMTGTTPALTYVPERVASKLVSSTTANLNQPASIQDLAQQLGFNPLQIYMHVRNTYRFELYSGLLKGLQATL